jgi:hypothetical protein
MGTRNSSIAGVLTTGVVEDEPTTIEVVVGSIGLIG